jgi:hypothetical protein
LRLSDRRSIRQNHRTHAEHQTPHFTLPEHVFQ